MGKKSKKPSKQAPKPKAAAAAGPTAVPIESAQIYSAHKTIAVYQGTEDGVATFGVATYLRYAKADASKAEEPRHDLVLPLAEADRHTALLSESAEGAISSVVASLSIGDRVELRLSGRREGDVGSDEVGQILMEELSEVDAVAYVRFASVYRAFESVEQFVEAIRPLQGQ